MEPKRIIPNFTSSMTKGEFIAGAVYLPVHIALLPLLLGAALTAGWMGEATANFLCYAIGVVYMLIFEWRFLRREFDPLCENALRCLSEICVGYALMLLCNLAVATIMQGTSPADNQNNAAIIGMVGQDYGKVAAMSVFLAPIVEELLFRAVIFGRLRRINRPLAYAVSMLLFSLYHVWAFAISDPTYFIYLLQYLPVSFLLCRCYERSNTIWGSIFLHMLINGVALNALTALQEML